VGSLMLSPGADRYQGQRNIKRGEGDSEVPLRHRYVLELHLAGKTSKEIQQLTHYAYSTIYKILASDDIVTLRQQLMTYYDSTFELLFPDVIKAVREGLEATEMKDRLQAAKLWLKAHGRVAAPKEDKGDTYNITAEDVVFQILSMSEGRKVEAAGNG